MRNKPHITLFVVIITTCMAVLLIGGTVLASQPQIEGLSPDFVMKANLRGGPFTLKGSFRVTWDEYVVTGLLAEGDSNKGYLKVTSNPHVVQQGENPLELTSDVLEVETESQRLVAIGNVHVTGEDLTVTATRLEGGIPDKLWPVVADMLAKLPEQVQLEIKDWWRSAGEKDQLFLLQGTVAGNTPEVTFSGEILLFNATTELFMFAGPSQITYNNTSGQ